MHNLTVTAIQRELLWESPEANRDQYASMFTDLRGQTDLVVLPEMFTTGFSMDASRLAEPEAETTLPWMLTQAEANGFAIVGSLPVAAEGGIYNRLLFATPEGEHYHYDKRHLFRMAGEHERYAAGSDKLILEWRGWRICPMVCYDLRFPVWIRNTGDYDLLLFVANWPGKRRDHWRQLLIARAIENQVYTVGVNRIGRDANDLDYSGDSLVLAADGEILVDCEDRSGAFTVELNAEAMETYRRKFPCHLDADNFRLE